MVAEPATPDIVIPPRPLRMHPRAAEIIGEQVLRERQIVPYDLSEGEMHVAAASPDLARVARQLQRDFGYVAHVGWEVPDLVEQAITDYFTPGQLPPLVDEQVEAWLDALGSAAVTSAGRPNEGLEGERERLEALSLAADLPLVRIERWQPDPALARLLPEEFARARRVLPFVYAGGVVYVLTANAADRNLPADLGALLGGPVQLAVAAEAPLQAAIDHAYAAPPLQPDGRIIAPGRVERLLGWRPSLEALRGPDGQEYDSPATVSDERRLRARARELQLRTADLSTHTSMPEVAALVPRAVAERLGCLVLSVSDEQVRLAVTDADPYAVAEATGALLGRPVEPVLAERAAIQAAIARSYVDTLAPALPPPPVDVYIRLARSFTPATIAGAQSRVQRTSETLVQAMLALGLVDLDDLAEMHGLRAGIPWLRLATALPSAEALDALSAESARELRALPLRRQGAVLHVAVESLDNLPAIERATGCTVRPVLAEPGDLDGAVARLYAAARRDRPALEALLNNLQATGRISRRQRVEALAANAITDLPADVALVRAGAGTQLEVATLLAEQSGRPMIDVRRREQHDAVIGPLGAFGARRTVVDPVDPGVARLLPLALAEQLTILPVRALDQRVVVAVADPLDGAGIQRAADAIGRTLSVQVAPRGSLEAAIRRSLGRRNIGDYLVETGLVTPEELVRALELHRRTGVRIGKALLTLGYVTQEQLGILLAEQLAVPFFDVTAEEIDPAVARLVPEEVCRQRGMLPLAVDDDAAMVAMIDPIDPLALDDARLYLQRRVEPVLTTERQFDDAMEAVYRDEYLIRSASDLLSRAPEDSAYQVLSKGQKVALGVAAAVVLAGLALNYIVTLSVIVSFAVVFYFAFSAYKLFLIYKSLSRSLEIVVTPEEIAALDEHELPLYSVIVPMYKEGEVLPILVDALDRLDYPKTKLEVLLMLEEDDTATVQMARRMRLPESFRVLVVPHGQPKGKPKACNYGLIHARGELVVLYDAEDVPESDQLKKALVAFRRGGERVVTVQAKLNYFNRDQNLLTRWFTSEYATWFDLLLPGLDSSGAPVPLGGTSNHFRTNVLRELGGWDPFNVTEDADLGIRLFKRGYRTSVVNSTTYEEANSNLYNWIRQRSRWIKGYMQTWLVHMRHPLRLWRTIGTYPFISMQLIIAGTFFAFLMNPIFWGLTALWFLSHWGIIEKVFPGPIFYIGTIALYFGNFAFVYISVAGALKREYHSLVKYVLLTPIYWGLMSIAAWKALYQLVFRPSYWEKTEHGLYRGKVKMPKRAPVPRTP